MNEPLIQLGVGGILVLMVLKEVFGFLRRRNGNDPVTALLTELLKLTREIYRTNLDLHDWHDKTDAYGRRLWYPDPSFNDAVKSLAEHTAVQTEVLRALVSDIKSMHEELVAISKQSG